MTARPLRVAVTRDEGPDGPLSRAIRRCGAVPVPCPVVTSLPPADDRPLRRAARDLERYAWMIVASARAADAVVAARGDVRLPPALRTAAVGPSTAARLVAYGAASPLAPPREGTGALLQLLESADVWPGRRVLLPRAREGSDELARALDAWGAAPDEVIAYRTVARDPGLIVASWIGARPDAVVVASPSAARALLAALPADAVTGAVRVVAIGPTTAAALARLKVAAAVAPRADFDAAAREACGVPVSSRGPSP